MRTEKNFRTTRSDFEGSQDKSGKFWNYFQKYLKKLQEYENRQQEKFGENWKEEWKLTTPGIHARYNRSKAILWAELDAASKQSRRSWFDKLFFSAVIYPPELHDSEISMPENPRRCTDEEINGAWEDDEEGQKDKIIKYVNGLFPDYLTDSEVRKNRRKKLEQMLEDARVRREQEREKRSKRRLSWIAYHIWRKGHHARAADIRKAEEYEANWTSFAKELEKQSGFDSWDLSQIDDELQLFMGCVLAAHEKVSGLGAEMKSRGINQRFEPLGNNFDENGRLRSTCMSYSRRYGENNLRYDGWKYTAEMVANSLESMLDSIKNRTFSLEEDARDYLRDLFHKEKIPLSFIAVLQPILHENGHRFACNIFDKGILDRLPPNAKNIVEDVPEKNSFEAQLQFDMFSTIKLKEYLLTEANKQAKTGEFVTDGVFYEPGKERFSLSEYGKTKPDEFIAELYAKVRTTPPNAYLNPLGRAMRELINNDGRKFTKWLGDEIQKENGAYYKRCVRYLNRVEHLVSQLAGDGSLTFEKEVDDAYWKILRKFDYQGKRGRKGKKSYFGAFLTFLIKERMKKNYFDADTQDTADAAQKKLVHALNILDALPGERFVYWLNQLEELQQMGRYSSGAKGILKEKTYDRILDILVEKYHDVSHTDADALNKLLDTEIAIVEKDLDAAKKAAKVGKQIGDQKSETISEISEIKPPERTKPITKYNQIGTSNFGMNVLSGV